MTVGCHVRPEVARLAERRHPGSRLERLAGDASTRTFFRIREPDGSSVVLVDHGKSFRGETDYVRLSRIFGRAGLRVAEILEVDDDAGCLIIEDLGDETLESRLQGETARGGPVPPELLSRAARLAAEISSRGTPVLASSELAAGPTLDAERFRYEMDFFLEHFAAGLLGKRHLTSRIGDELHALAEFAAASPTSVLCHRDFHSRNLMVLADGSLAMVDIQDARWGPDSYDLASLLRDAYVELDESWLDPLVDVYLQTLEHPPDGSAFRERLGLVAAQRMIKALGSFGYLTRSKGTRRYLDAVPRTTGRLRRLLPTMEQTRELSELLIQNGLLDTGGL